MLIHVGLHVHRVPKNDTDVGRVSFDVYQPILIIFERNVPDGVCYQTLVLFSTSSN